MHCFQTQKNFVQFNRYSIYLCMASKILTMNFKFQNNSACESPATPISLPKIFVNKVPLDPIIYK